MNHDHYSDTYIAQILHSVRTIALVGASPNDIRPSNIVVKYLVAKGYRVFPINPGHAGKEIHGQTIYASLADVPEPIDMKESISAAASYVRSRAVDFGIEPPLFDKRDIHVHGVRYSDRQERRLL